MPAFTQTIHASANGISLIEAADYAAMRGLLDLEPGTDVLAPNGDGVSLTNVLHNVVDDTTPQFGGNVDGAGFTLHSGDNPLRSADAMLWIARDVDDDIDGNGHCFSDSSVVTRSGGIGYNSFDGRIIVTGTASYDHFAMFQSAPSYKTSGTVAKHYGLFDIPNVMAGTLTNRYGVYIADATQSGGTIEAQTGIHVAALSGVTNMAIVTAGSNPSLFGTVRINPAQTASGDVPATSGTLCHVGDGNLVLHTNRNGTGSVMIAAFMEGTGWRSVFETTATTGTTQPPAYICKSGGICTFGGAIVCGGDVDANGNTIHFGTEENEATINTTPSPNTCTVNLGAGNHWTIPANDADDDITATITVPPGPCAGRILIEQGATPRDITWTPSAGTVAWLGTEPTWTDASEASEFHAVSWTWNGTYLFLSDAGKTSITA